MPGFKLFRADHCVSYLLYDPQSKTALIVDPHLDLVPEYREYISALGLKLEWAFDTRTHFDHPSATYIFREHYGTKIAMSSETSSMRATHRVNDREKISVGSLAVECLLTPGVSKDAVCLLVDSKLLFSGDTLWIGSPARTDYDGSNPLALYKSLNEKVRSLQDATLIFPAHESNGILFSTLERERERNPDLSKTSESEWIQQKSLQRKVHMSDDLKNGFEFNREKMPSPDQRLTVYESSLISTPLSEGVSGSGFGSISVEKYAQKIQDRKSNFAWIDVREREEFAAGRIPGTKNIPLSELALHFDELRKSERVYVSCLSGLRSERAARTLSYLGLRDVVNVSGGFKAWNTAQLPVET